MPDTFPYVMPENMLPRSDAADKAASAPPIVENRSPASPAPTYPAGWTVFPDQEWG
jgi:hypothetical protein